MQKLIGGLTSDVVGLRQYYNENATRKVTQVQHISVIKVRSKCNEIYNTVMSH